MSIASDLEDRPPSIRSTAARKRDKQSAGPSPRLRMRTTVPGLLGTPMESDPAAPTPGFKLITVSPPQPRDKGKPERLGMTILGTSRIEDREPVTFFFGAQPLRARQDSAAEAFAWMLEQAAQQGVEGTRAAADAWRGALKHRRIDQAVAAALRLPLLLEAADARTAQRLAALAGDTISAIPERDRAAIEPIAEALVNALMANPGHTEAIARALRPHRARLRATGAWPYLRAALT